MEEEMKDILFVEEYDWIKIIVLDNGIGFE